MRLEAYLSEDSIINEVTYERYCQALDLSMNEGILDSIKDTAVAFVSKAFGQVKGDFEAIIKDFGVSINDILKAFKDKSFYSLMKSLGFNFMLLLKAINTLTGYIHKGLFKVFESIAKTGAFEKLKAGVITVDEIMNQHPILKKVSGLAVAGLLFYMWLNMTFIGHFDYDFDFSDIVAALRGNYSLADLFMSPSGLMLMTLFATGSIISVAWLGQTTYNLLAAIFYTLFKKAKGADHGILADLKSKVKFGKT
jgi:hypothetical protein